MRISVRHNDNGYAAYVRMLSRNQDFTIFLDGKEQACVITADEEQGYVLRQVRGLDNEPLVDAQNPKVVWEQVARGSVKIQLRA